MKKKNPLLQPARTLLVRSNEPRKTIPGGETRKSVIVPRGGIGLIRRREQLNAILLNHCASKKIDGQLKATDELLLHAIVRETIASGTSPVIRKRAIHALQHYPTSGTHELLGELAQYGEDEYIRAHAIQTLARMGTAKTVSQQVKPIRKGPRKQREAHKE